MSKSNREDLVSRLTTIVNRLLEGRADALVEMGDDALLALLQGQEDSSVQPTPAPGQMAYAGICIHFSLGGQPFEAVGFLEDGENSVLGNEALRRTDNGHLVRSNADWRFVYEHRAELPKELEVYWLPTARPLPGYPGNVSSLSRDCNWHDSWLVLDGPWRRNDLVLRRRRVSAS